MPYKDTIDPMHTNISQELTNKGTIEVESCITQCPLSSFRVISRGYILCLLLILIDAVIYWRNILFIIPMRTGSN